MIPMLVKIRIPKENGRILNLYLPLFVAWLVLAPVILLMLPLVLFAGILTWRRPYGRLVILMIPAFIMILWNMQGLEIDVVDKNGHLYLSFI